MVCVVKIPGIDTSDLRGSFVTSTMLALLMSFGKNFEQFLTDGNRPALITNHFAALELSQSKIARIFKKYSHTSVVPTPTVWSLNILLTQNLSH